MSQDQNDRPENRTTAENQRLAEQHKQFRHEVRQAGGPVVPEMDFNTFLLSLGHSAMLHMGSAGLPGGEKVEVNFEMAQQTIDILAMLEQRTRGSLTKEESELLSTLLYDLRLRYVQSLRETKK